jgi:hypothetical protein
MRVAYSGSTDPLKLDLPSGRRSQISLGLHIKPQSFPLALSLTWQYREARHEASASTTVTQNGNPIGQVQYPGARQIRHGWMFGLSSL